MFVTKKGGMRLVTFSVLRSCKLRPLLQLHGQRPRTLCACSASETEVTQTKPAAEPRAGYAPLVEVAATWPAHEHTELRARVLGDLRVLPGFVSEAEEEALLAELEPVLRRMRYEFDHWDNAIHGYRETERAAWRAENEAVMARVRREAFADPAAGVPLPHAHVLDLAAAGHIKPHVDAVRFCGEVIAGVCLASSAVMRLVHCAHEHLALHALLPRRGLYIMRGVARYEFTHAVLGGEESAWRGESLPRRRRVAVICRSRPEPAAPASPET